MKNENRFKEWLDQQNEIKYEHSHKRWSSKNDIHISVDFIIEESGCQNLIEIDSGNMAKLLVGQYTLLNLVLNEEQRKKSTLWIIHFYKNYNCNRTIKNLNFISEKLDIPHPLEFKVLHWNEIKNIENLKAFSEIWK